MVRTKSLLGAKATKMLDYINHIIRVELLDGRSFIGQFLAYDASMNVVLVHAREVVTKGINKNLPPLPNLPPEDLTMEKERGLVVIRGAMIVSVHICGPPPKDNDEIPKQFYMANVQKFYMDYQLGNVTTPPPGMLMGMMPRPGMMMPPRPMMSPGAPGVAGAPGTAGASASAPPGGAMPNAMPGAPGMMPFGMVPPPGMVPPRPGMVPPPGMMPPRPGMMPPPGGAPQGMPQNNS